MAFQIDISDSTDTTIDIEVPKNYRVILLNDDFTTMEFVVDILTEVFHKPEEEAYAIMMSVHQSGKGVAGIYPYDIAATKCQITLKKAREAGFPLKCTLEKE